MSSIASKTAMQRSELVDSHFLRFRPFSYRHQHAARESLLALKSRKFSYNTGQANRVSAPIGAAAIPVVDEVETENEPRQQTGASTSSSGSTLPARWNPEDLDDGNIHRTLKSLQSRQEAAAQQFVLVGTGHEAGRSGRRVQSTASNIARFRRRSLKQGTAERRSHAAALSEKRVTDYVEGKPLEWDEEVELCSALKEYQRVQDVRAVLLEREEGAAEASVHSGTVAAEWARAAGLPNVEALQQVLEKGCRASYRLLTAVEPLLYKMSRPLVRHGMELEDVVSEARTLWLNAALAFDPERGARFNTFAYMAVRRKLNMVIDQDGPLLQEGSSRIWHRYRLAMLQEQLRGNDGAPPSVEQLAVAVGLSEQRVRGLIAPSKTLSLEHVFINDDKDSNPLEEKFGQSQHEGDENLDRATLRDLKSQLVHCLLAVVSDPIAADMLVMRYGLFDGQPLHFYEIGDIFNTSHETVRKKINRALQEVRTHAESVNTLRAYALDGVLSSAAVSAADAEESML